MTGVRTVIAQWTDKIQAKVISSRPLLYRDGADVSEDVPAHVRAGSAMGISGQRIVVFQDDTNVVALLDRADSVVTPILLPRGHQGARQFGGNRDNKKHKLDLEACVALDDHTLLAFGSGSTLHRQSVVVLENIAKNPSARVVSGSPLYEAFNREKSFCGSELNIEGVARVGSRLRFFQRGNGAAVGGLQPVNATADVEIETVLAVLHGEKIPVELFDIAQYDLGKISSIRATFTDAWSTGREECEPRIWFLASAEDSPDTYHDGAVMGSAIGCIYADQSAHIALIQSADGSVFREKAEGLAVDPNDPSRAFVVVDKDDPAIPSQLFEISLTQHARSDV